MLTFDQDDLARLRTDLLDLIVKHATGLVDGDGDEQAWLAAMLHVDAGLRSVMPRVRKTLDERALRAGLSQAAIGRARGSTRQAVNGRVKAS